MKAIIASSIFLLPFLTVSLQAQGNFAYFGSVIGKSGVGPGAGTPDIYWDDRIVQGGWPPPGIDLPRIVTSRWEVEM